MTNKELFHKIVALTDVGLERDHNEDFLAYCPDISQKTWLHENVSEFEHIGEAGSIMVVADGMGGTNAGEVASQLSCGKVENYFVSNFKGEVVRNADTIRSFLTDALLYAHQAVKTHQHNDPETAGMGTTIVVAWIIKDEAYISWVGDSRCYLLRENGDYRLISKDHSLVQELIDDKSISEEMAFNHPNKNIITQHLGSDELPVPGFVICHLEPNDRLLLCSDGLNTMLRDETIFRIVSENQDDILCSKTLIEESKNAGGYDNITVILYRKSSEGQKNAGKNIVASKTTPTDDIKKPLLNWKKTITNLNFWLLVVSVIALIALVIYLIIDKPFKEPDIKLTTDSTKVKAIEDSIKRDTAKIINENLKGEIDDMDNIPIDQNNKDVKNNKVDDKNATKNTGNTGKDDGHNTDNQNKDNNKGTDINSQKTDSIKPLDPFKKKD